jgi:hypothetical protein
MTKRQRAAMGSNNEPPSEEGRSSWCQIRATASSAECTPSLAMRFCRWVRTVLTDRCSCSATASRCPPLAARQARTSRWRGVSLASRRSFSRRRSCSLSSRRITSPVSLGDSQVSPQATPRMTASRCPRDSSWRTQAAAPARIARTILVGSADELSMITRVGAPRSDSSRHRRFAASSGRSASSTRMSTGSRPVRYCLGIPTGTAPTTSMSLSASSRAARASAKVRC